MCSRQSGLGIIETLPQLSVETGPGFIRQLILTSNHHVDEGWPYFSSRTRVHVNGHHIQRLSRELKRQHTPARKTLLSV